MLEIPKKIFDELMAHLREEYPLEGCGVLAGKKVRVERSVRLTNTKKSPLSFLADPLEQVKMLREIEDSGLELLAIYHSHPHTDPYPSSEDVDKAFYPDSLNLIISLRDMNNPVAKVYRIVNREITEGEFFIL
jgi:proteasome lid subunit RPN8/RPN11